MQCLAVVVIHVSVCRRWHGQTYYIHRLISWGATVRCCQMCCLLVSTEENLVKFYAGYRSLFIFNCSFVNFISPFVIIMSLKVDTGSLSAILFKPELGYEMLMPCSQQVQMKRSDRHHINCSKQLPTLTTSSSTPDIDFPETDQDLRQVQCWHQFWSSSSTIV